MVDAIVSSAIEKLGAFIAQEVNILLEVKDKLRWLKDELRYLQSSVRSAESRLEEEQIRNWVEDVRDKNPERFQCSPTRICSSETRRNEYRIDNILATPNKQQKDRTLLRITAINNQVEVVGFEDEIKILKAELNSDNLSLKVISIHGMGGSGKTSLATNLYNSSELRNFDTRAKYLTKLLEDRGCYLALIDDIWDIKAWIQIKDAFPDQKNGSRIIITTRNKKVAEMADDKCFVHRLRFLTEDESWELFCKRAEPTTPNLKKLGREMVGICRGLPLAIVVLSGLLSHNMSYDYWSKVKEHIWRHLKDNDFSPQIGEIPSLSFNDLSPQMKDCFLYLARYPEDHGIDLDELKRLWIAEEFISEAEEGEGVIMEDLAEDCLKELINCNLLQVNKLLWNGEVESFRVHDLVRDLSINKAKEHKLLVISDSGPIEIPPSIGRLKKLQTLHGGWRTYYTVPREICELHELRHLDIEIRGSLNIGKHQTKLQTLGGCRIECKEWMKIDTVNLTNLHALSICDREEEEAEEEGYTLESVANLTSLQTFSLRFMSVKTQIVLQSSQERVLIRYSKRSIGTMSSARFNHGFKSKLHENGFPSLQILRLKDFVDLEELEVEDGAFPSLKQFQTLDCPKLKNIPVQLERWVTDFIS
ncbi:hypothetical protein AgCh_023460 [Apium graveolens]